MQKLKLKIESLAYSCNNKKILKNINLELQGNQIIALLGPNGAGKSTFLKALSAQLICNKSTIVFNDYDSHTNRFEYLSQIGYMPEVACFFPELTVLEQLQLFAHSKKVCNLDKCVDEVLELCNLNSVQNHRINKLSLGYKQRLNLAQALMNQPKLLLLDEPLDGLDPILIIEFRKIIKQASQTSIVFLSTHILPEAELISDSVVFMMHGNLSDPISANIRTQKWLAKFSNKISSKLESELLGFAGFEIQNKHLFFEGNESVAKQFLNKVNPQDELYYLAPMTSNLEQLYLEHTKEEEQ